MQAMATKGTQDMNQADMILKNGPSARKEMLHQLNLGNQAYRLGDYKIIVGNPGEYWTTLTLWAGDML